MTLPSDVSRVKDAKTNPLKAFALWFGSLLGWHLGRPLPVWGLFATLGILMWWMSGSGDQLPKRWKPPNLLWGFERETETPLFARLVNQSPSVTCDIAAQDENAPIPAMHHNWNCPHVAVYSVAAQSHTVTTLRDLGDQGQAEAVRFLAKNGGMSGKTLSDLRDALNDSGAAASGEKDPFRFDRVLVATVAKGANWEPGDRMMWTRVFVQPINFHFAGYTVAATDTETVKVTSVEATSTRKLSADLETTVPGAGGPKASVGPSGERSVKTTSDINAEYEKLGIDIMPNFLRIIRESQRGGDVVGNATVSLTAVTDPETIRKRFPKDASRRDPNDDDVVLLVTGIHVDGDTQSTRDDRGAQAQFDAPLIPIGTQAAPIDAPAPFDVLPQVPVPHCPLWARVWMLYEQRRVDSGQESYDESKHGVTLVRDAEAKEDVEIMSADEVSPAVWSIQICDLSKCESENSTPLKARVKDGKGAQRKLVFEDYGLAVRFAHWLRTTPPGVLDGSKYAFNYPSSTPGSYEILRPIKNLDDECNVQKSGAGG
jgi:hypothetical protein